MIGGGRRVANVACLRRSEVAEVDITDPFRAIGGEYIAPDMAGDWVDLPRFNGRVSDNNYAAFWTCVTSCNCASYSAGLT
jgi:hypothetical protein